MINQQIINIIFIVCIIYLFYKNFCYKNNIEKMSNSSTIEREINRIYNADVHAIRNLAEISKKLQSGSLTIPGNLTVKGSLFVKRGADIKGTTATNKVNLRGCQLYRGWGNTLVIRNGYGYADIGPKNRYWSHFITDRPNFYFNKAGHFNGNSQKYRGPRYATTSDLNNTTAKTKTLVKKVNNNSIERDNTLGKLSATASRTFGNIQKFIKSYTKYDQLRKAHKM